MFRWTAMPAVVAAGLMAVPTVAAAKPVAPEQFGLHVASLGAGGKPSIDVRAVRLWDAGVRWDQIETAKGKYNWAPLDRAVSAAEAAGATDILYVLGSTPKWAASTFSSADLYGPGTASLPKKSKYYLNYAEAVAQRYKGRITAYQIWNEANTRSFYNGGKYDGWIKLAALTKTGLEDHPRRRSRARTSWPHPAPSSRRRSSRPRASSSATCASSRGRRRRSTR